MKSTLTLIASLFLLGVTLPSDLLSMKKVEQDGNRVSARHTAQKMLPLRDAPYEYEELMAQFSPYLKIEEEREFYVSSLKLMFNLRSKHPDVGTCLESLMNGFESTIQFIFNIDPERDGLCFPAPKHPVETVISGWQCLLKKLIKSEKKTDPDERSQKVKNALLDTLALHKPIIEKLDPRLFEIVNAHAPCENCVNTARQGAFIKSGD